MMIPIRCISCGRPVAHLWEKFKARVEAGEDAQKVLDDLGVKKYCCRSLFLTHVDLTKEIGKFNL